MTDLAPGAMGADMRSLLPPVRDQGERSTCRAFAVTGAHEFARAAGIPVTEHLSEGSAALDAKGGARQQDTTVAFPLATEPPGLYAGDPEGEEPTWTTRQ